MKTNQVSQLSDNVNSATAPYLVIGGNGKTGRRVVEHLSALGHDVRGVSRSSDPSFDWNDDANWSEVLAGVKALYVTYHPDLSVPGASDHIRSLLTVAKAQGVERIVLLSGRGEEEAQRCEQIVRATCRFQRLNELLGHRASR